MNSTRIKKTNRQAQAPQALNSDSSSLKSTEKSTEASIVNGSDDKVASNSATWVHYPLIMHKKIL